MRHKMKYAPCRYAQRPGEGPGGGKANESDQKRGERNTSIGQTRLRPPPPVGGNKFGRRSPVRRRFS